MNDSNTTDENEFGPMIARVKRHNVPVPISVALGPFALVVVFGLFLIPVETSSQAVGMRLIALSLSPMGVFFSVGLLLPPWEVEARTHGFTYRYRRRVDSLHWDQIQEAKVIVGQRPVMYYIILSNESPRKITFWLFEPTDRDVILAFDHLAANLSYWRDQYRRMPD